MLWDSLLPCMILYVDSQPWASMRDRKLLTTRYLSELVILQSCRRFFYICLFLVLYKAAGMTPKLRFSISFKSSHSSLTLLFVLL